MTRPEGQARFKLPLLYNSGTTIVDSSSILLVQDNNGYTNRYPYPWTIVIDNAGTLTVKNGTTIKHDVVGYANYSANCILNNTGTLTLEDTRINQERRDIPNTDWSNIGDTYGIYNTGTTNYINSTLDLSHYNVYGIYAESGNVNIYSGTVKTTAPHNAFALWAKAGAITLGEAEPTDSPNYGTANANVSTTSPNISAIGGNLGIGVTLETGSFNFYDGKITQNLSLSGNIRPTKNWNISFTASYDFNAHKLAYMNCNISRDLHCFTMTASVIPVGPYKSYNFHISVNSSMLSDLKYDKRSSYSNGVQWY
jgi:hypothetical protein